MKRNSFIRIGLIISITLFGLVWGVNFLKGKGTFKSDSTYYIIYDRIDGLAKSNPVMVNGFAIGQVDHIGFTADTSGRLIVEISVKDKVELPGGSVARIFSSDLMGTKAIELIFGDEDFMHHSGDTLIPDFEGSLQEMVSVQMLPIKNQAETLLKQMEDAINVINLIFNEETRNRIQSSIKNIENTFSNLESSSTNLDSIVSGGKNNIENILTNVESITLNLEKNNNLITQSLNNVSQITDSLAQANLKQTLLETYALMANLNEITDKINNSEGTIGELVNNDTLYYNLEDVTYSLNRLLEDMRLNPKRYVQFSAFNLGKTVYVEKDESSNKKKKKDNVIYKIIIKQSNNSIPITPENFKGYKNVEEVMINGSYSYLIGKEKNIENARLYRKDVSSDFPEAQILEIKQGEYSIIN